MKRLEDLHSELVHLKELRGDLDESQTDDEEEVEERKDDDEDNKDEKELDPQDSSDNKDDAAEKDSPDKDAQKPRKLTKAERRALEEKKEMEERISEGASEAAVHYHHLL